MIVWRRRANALGAYAKAHAFRDGEPMCHVARIPPGTASVFQGRPISGFGPAEELSAGGVPYGNTCTMCAAHVRRTEAA